MPTITPLPAGSIHFHGSTFYVSTGTAWIPITSGMPQDMSMYEVQFKVSHKASQVNSKRIAEALVDVVRNTVNDFVYVFQTCSDSTYEYSQMVEYLNLVLEEMVRNKEITTFDVIGDTRNNQPTAVRRGEISIDVYYQQFNCLNTTEIKFKITTG